MGQGGDNVPYAVYTIQGNVIDREAKCNGSGIGKDVSPTINTVDRHAVCYVANSSGNDVSGTIDAHYYLGCGARGGKEREFVAIALDRSAYNQGKNAKYDIGIDTEGIAFTVTAKGPCAVCCGETQYVVRRLTPLECCRLQGMPDWWEDDVDGADSARYKMWGNGMALPNALYVMEGFIKWA